VSPYECSVNPGPQISYLWRHNVPTWTGTLCIWDDSYMGPEVPEDSYPSNTNTDSLPVYLFFYSNCLCQGSYSQGWSYAQNVGPGVHLQVRAEGAEHEDSQQQQVLRLYGQAEALA